MALIHYAQLAFVLFNYINGFIWYQIGSDGCTDDWVYNLTLLFSCCSLTKFIFDEFNFPSGLFSVLMFLNIILSLSIVYANDCHIYKTDSCTEECQKKISWFLWVNLTNFLCLPIYI